MEKIKNFRKIKDKKKIEQKSKEIIEILNQSNQAKLDLKKKQEELPWWDNNMEWPIKKELYQTEDNLRIVEKKKQNKLFNIDSVINKKLDLNFLKNTKSVKDNRAEQENMHKFMQKFITLTKKKVYKIKEEEDKRKQSNTLLTEKKKKNEAYWFSTNFKKNIHKNAKYYDNNINQNKNKNNRKRRENSTYYYHSANDKSIEKKNNNINNKKRKEKFKYKYKNKYKQKKIIKNNKDFVFRKGKFFKRYKINFKSFPRKTFKLIKFYNRKNIEKLQIINRYKNKIYYYNKFYKFYFFFKNKKDFIKRYDFYKNILKKFIFNKKLFSKITKKKKSYRIRITKTDQYYLKYAHTLIFKFTKTNIYATFCNFKHKILLTKSLGCLKIKTKKEKASLHSNKKLFDFLNNWLYKKYFYKYKIIIKIESFKNKYYLYNDLLKFFLKYKKKVVFLIYKKAIPHNTGLRLPKKRRI